MFFAQFTLDKKFDFLALTVIPARITIKFGSNIRIN